MFNFGSMFGQIRNASTPSLSQLLNAPTTTLVRLLDDDNFISDFRSDTQQVREQSMTYKRMEEMVDLVTTVGDPSDKKRSYKCPLTAADLLSCETAFVFDKLLPEGGVVVQEEKVVTTLEREVQQEAEDDNDDELQVSSSEEGSREEKSEDRQTKSEDKTCCEDDEEFGDFVAAPVRPKRILKIKEVVQTVTVIKKEYPALVDKILEYFHSNINFTLTSYCCKVLTSLLNKRTSKFLDKLFENERHPAAIFRHIESRSTVQFLTRVFTIQTSYHLEFRVLLFKKLLKQSSIPHDLDTASNISATLCETFEKINTNSKSINPCKDLQDYFKFIPQMLEQAVSNIICQNETVSTYSVPFIYQLLNSLPAILDNDDIDITLYKFVKGAIVKLEQVVAQKKTRLGVGRVRMIEILNFILKRTKIKEYLSQQQDFFSLLFSIITLYPLNNILHNEAFKLITMALNPEHSSLLESLLSKEKLINWLFEEAQQETLRLSSERPKVSKGYKAHLLNLCKKLKEVSISNPSVLELVNDARFAEAYIVFVENVAAIIDRNLGGYATHKAAKFQIMTSKEQILKYHATFLANARPAIFEVDPEDAFQNPILLEELQRQLDGIEFQNKDETRPQEVIEEEKHKAELIQENQQHKSAFWKMHLDYDVDELMHEVV